MLIRMRTRFRRAAIVSWWGVLVLLLAPFARAAPALENFRRGTNLSHWYAQSIVGHYDESHLSTYITPADLALIKRMGFDHVRLTVDDATITDFAQRDRLHEQNFTRFRARLDALLAAGLNVVVDLHPSDTYKIELHQPHAQDNFVQLWALLARALADTDPKRVWLEVLNEPGPSWRADAWRPVQARVLAAIRAGAPGHTVVLSGGGWGAVETLVDFVPHVHAGDVVYTFHFYEPAIFTHQAANWSWKAAQQVGGLGWPHAREEADAVAERVTSDAEARGHVRHQIANGWFQKPWIEAKFDEVARWQKRHGGVPVYVGEFGAYALKTPPDARLRFYADCREGFEARGWGWATWDYAGGFGMATGKPGQRVADEAMRKSLGLTDVQ